MNRVQRRRLVWTVRWAGAGMLLGVAFVALALIVVPVGFRSLSPEDQYRIIRRLPFMASLLPTQAPELSNIPTVHPPGADAMALLATTAPVVSTATPTIIIPPTVTLTETPLPPTVTFTHTPTATNTPTVTNTSTGLVALATNTRSVHTEATVVVASTATHTATYTAIPTETSTPTHTSTAVPPTETPTQTPTSSLPTAVAFELPVSVRLRGMTWEPQKFNNCGPANLVQALRFYKWRDTQVQVAAWLKPTPSDKNVSPWQLVEYVNTQTKLRAITRVGGNMDLIKRLVAKQFGVLIETGFYDPDEPQEGWIGHYLTIIGYNDNEGKLSKLDTYKGEKSEQYEVIDELWSHFNRRYLVLYAPQREAELAQILGPDWDTTYNAQHALETAREVARLNPGNPFAWFNMGSSMVILGQYKEAAVAYDQARSVGGGLLPFRITWYEFGPFEAYYNAGRLDEALALIEFTISTTKGEVEEMFYWRGLISAARGNTAAAIADFDAALQFNANFTPAAVAKQQVQNGTFQGPKG